MPPGTSQPSLTPPPSGSRFASSHEDKLLVSQQNWSTTLLLGGGSDVCVHCVGATNTSAPNSGPAVWRLVPALHLRAGPQRPRRQATKRERFTRIRSKRAPSVIHSLGTEDVQHGPDRPWYLTALTTSTPQLTPPQVRVQRHTVEHIVDLAPMVRILGDPVPQMVDQLGLHWVSRCPRKGGPPCLRPSSYSSPSRTLAFQFPALVVSWIMDLEVCRVFTQNRVHFSLLSSRTLTIQFPVEVFKSEFNSVFFSSTGRVVSRFFSDFSPAPKKREGRRAVECVAGCALQLIHAERSSNGSWSSWGRSSPEEDAGAQQQGLPRHAAH